MLELLPLHLQSGIGFSGFADTCKKLFDFQTQLIGAQKSTTPASQTVKKTDLREQRFAEFEQSHIRCTSSPISEVSYRASNRSPLIRCRSSVPQRFSQSVSAANSGRSRRGAVESSTD